MLYLFNFLVEILPFLLSSSTSLALIYYKIPLVRIQQGVSVLLVILLLLLVRVSRRANSSFFARKSFAAVTVFLLSLFIQLLVIATGGFFSPLLIVIHLFVMGVSFLLNLKSAIIFLFFSLIVLIVNTQLNVNMLQLFYEDPSSVILYVISFLVIIPLAETITRTYHVKDALSKKLGAYLQLSESKSESILRGLNDFVVITDDRLNIVSVNGAIEKVLKTTEEQVVKKPLFDVIKLFGSDGKPATVESLQIENILKDKYARIIEGFSFLTQDRLASLKVTIQIRPIVDQEKNISQIVFVITMGDGIASKQNHSDLDQAKGKQKDLYNQLKKVLVVNNLNNDRLKFELFNKAEQDIITAQELEDHPFKPLVMFEDVGFICKQVIRNKIELAQDFGISLEFAILDDEELESSYLKVRESNPAIAKDTSSSYTTLIDVKWFGILVDKFIDLALLLAVGQKEKNIKVAIKHQGNLAIEILIIGPSPNISEDIKEQLFEEYYGKLGSQTNLNMGSGLEGYIVKTVSSQLGIPLSMRYEVESSRMVFSLVMNKSVS